MKCVRACATVCSGWLLSKRATIIRLLVVTTVVNMVLLSTVILRGRLHLTTTLTLTLQHESDVVLITANRATTTPLSLPPPPPPPPPDPPLLCLFTSFNIDERKTTVGIKLEFLTSAIRPTRCFRNLNYFYFCSRFGYFWQNIVKKVCNPEMLAYLFFRSRMNVEL